MSAVEDSLPGNLVEWEGRVLDVKNTTVTVQLFNGSMPPRSLCPLCDKSSFLVYTECSSCSSRVCEGCLRAAAIIARNPKVIRAPELAKIEPGKVPCPVSTQAIHQLLVVSRSVSDRFLVIAGVRHLGEARRSLLDLARADLLGGLLQRDHHRGAGQSLSAILQYGGEQRLDRYELRESSLEQEVSSG